VTATAKKPHSRDLVSAVLLLKLSASEKLVLQALCHHYPNAYPSVARIADMASQSERWVRRCLRSLQKKGLIEVYYRRDGQVQDTSSYAINAERILMQAGVRAKTTLKNAGTQFRGVGNSLPAEGEELTSAKQRALDRKEEQEKNNKESNITVRESSQQTCQEKELPIYENPHPDGEVVIDKDGFEILTDSPHDQLDDQPTQTQPENINPCQEERVSSESNNLTHPHPPSCAAPPSPSLPTPVSSEPLQQRPAPAPRPEAKPACKYSISQGDVCWFIQDKDGKIVGRAPTGEQAFVTALRMSGTPHDRFLAAKSDGVCKVFDTKGGVASVVKTCATFEEACEEANRLSKESQQPRSVKPAA